MREELDLLKMVFISKLFFKIKKAFSQNKKKTISQNKNYFSKTILRNYEGGVRPSQMVFIFYNTGCFV